MQETEADFTMTFRQLGDLPLMSSADIPVVDDTLWALKQLNTHRMFPHWLKLYKNRLHKNGDGETDDIRKQRTTGRYYYFLFKMAEMCFSHLQNRGLSGKVYLGQKFLGSFIHLGLVSQKLLRLIL